MTTDELRVQLLRIINVYVSDSDVRERLYVLVSRINVPAQAVLAELDPWLYDDVVTDSDAKIIKEIAFYFC